MKPMTMMQALELEEYMNRGPDPRRVVQERVAVWIAEHEAGLYPFDDGVREVLERIIAA